MAGTDKNILPASQTHRIAVLSPVNIKIGNNMKKNEKYPIYSYSNRELKILESYIEKEFGEYQEVFHEIVSPDIHLDIAIIPPNAGQDYYKLVTFGAGAYKMNVPKELKKYKLTRAEYAIFLPKTWDIKSEKEEYYWAIRQLKNIARLPVDCETWLAFGHTITANEDFSPVAENTKLNSFVLLNSIGKNNQIVKPVKINPFEEINFYQLYPLYQEELDYKLQNSLDDLMNKIDETDLDFVVNINRKNYCLQAL